VVLDGAHMTAAGVLTGCLFLEMFTD